VQFGKTVATYGPRPCCILRLKTLTETLPETHQRFLSAAQSFLPGRVSTSLAIREQHANALTLLETQLPDLVVWPETTDEVARLVALASELSVPLIAFGGGTSLEGHLNAPFGGVSLDMSRMNAVLAIRPEDMDCTSGRCDVRSTSLGIARHGVVFCRRSWCRTGDARRHGGNARVRHDDAPLWLNARERHLDDGGFGIRRNHSHSAPRAQIVCRV